MKIFTIMIEILTVLFLLWGFISYVDVLMHQMDPDYVYSSLNAFILLIKVSGH